MPLAPGTRLGPYEIVAPLGAGGMGEVYRARDTRLGRDVAIKALPAAFAQRPRAARALRARGADCSRRSTTRTSPAIYGLEEAAGAPLPGARAGRGRDARRAPRARAAAARARRCALGVQIAAAIEAAHERGVVHRDLKPGNVMITPRGRREGARLRAREERRRPRASGADLSAVADA